MRYRKSARLKDFDYTGWYAYSLTLVTRSRRRYFTAAGVVRMCLEALGQSLRRNGAVVRAYCFMPDHVHLLLQGKHDVDMREVVRSFKQLSGYRFKLATGERLWQTSYWDHVLRKDEDMYRVATYIWGNPVRAGLCVDYRAYPFSGPRKVWAR
jgi:putative transposase